MKPAPVEVTRIVVEPRPPQEPVLTNPPNPYDEDVDVNDYPAIAGFLSLAGLLPCE